MAPRLLAALAVLAAASSLLGTHTVHAQTNATATDCIPFESMFAASGRALPWPKGNCCAFFNTSDSPNPNIECIGGRVVYARLWNLGLAAPIPDTIGNPTKMVQLALQNSALYGRIPSTLSQLPSLDTLWLSNNKLEGPIPDLSMLPLTKLDLQGNSLSGSIDNVIPSTLKFCQLTQNGNPLLSSCKTPAPCLTNPDGSKQIFLDSCTTTNVGGIVGGVIAAVVVVTAIVGVLLWRRRRRAQDEASLKASFSQLNLTDQSSSTFVPPSLPPTNGSAGLGPAGLNSGSFAAPPYSFTQMKSPPSQHSGSGSVQAGGPSGQLPMSGTTDLTVAPAPALPELTVSSGSQELGQHEPHWAFARLVGALYESEPKVDLPQRLQVMVAEQAFTPSNPDEVALSAGDQFKLWRVFRDGWGLGRNVATDQTGLIPLDHLRLPGANSPLTSLRIPTGSTSGLYPGSGLTAGPSMRLESTRSQWVSAGPWDCMDPNASGAVMGTTLDFLSDATPLLGSDVRMPYAHGMSVVQPGTVRGPPPPDSPVAGVKTEANGTTMGSGRAAAADQPASAGTTSALAMPEHEEEEHGQFTLVLPKSPTVEIKGNAAGVV